ncbi:MAG: COQ9 family protein [Rhodospirillales bacterium]|nr:COQ9 family protein [Rhodospirillales bacterium]
MTDSLQTRRDKIVEKMLDHVAFDGWSRDALIEGALAAGYAEDVALRAFPDGMGQVAEHFADWSDRRMVAALAAQDLEAIKIRERIHACVKTRIQLNMVHKEAIRRLMSYLALPANAPLAARLAWRSCSAMWYAAGDRSADWNHYTKRGLLVSVYSATLLYWLGDSGDEAGDYPQTWAFLDRRISDVLKTFALPGKLKASLLQLAATLAPGRASRDSRR